MKNKLVQKILSDFSKNKFSWGNKINSNKNFS